MCAACPTYNKGNRDVLKNPLVDILKDMQLGVIELLGQLVLGLVGVGLWVRVRLF